MIPMVEQSTADLYGVQLVSLEELLTNADYITIHTSLTQETRHLINEKTLSLMKPTALLVNTSRGPVVDGTALARSLEKKELEAAALDVTEIEPMDAQDPLLSLPNVMVTPPSCGLLTDIPGGMPNPSGGEHHPGVSGRSTPWSGQSRSHQDYRCDACHGTRSLGRGYRIFQRHWRFRLLLVT